MHALRPNSRLLAVLALVGVYGLLQLRVAVPLVHYQVNKAYYLERCENVLRPELKCEGKCVLGKLLQTRYEQEKAAAEAMPTLPPVELPAHTVAASSIRLGDGPLQERHVCRTTVRPLSSGVGGVDSPPPKG